MEAFNEFLDSIVIPNLHKNPLDYVLEMVPETKVQVIVELGVYRGSSITKIANKYTNTTIYGFDSFDGLPESWNRPDGSCDKGTFSLHGQLPIVPSNVELIRGWFSDTLPSFVQMLKSQNKKIQMLHIDCDLYSSTKCAFDNLEDVLDNDVYVVFDELFNYPTFEKHEIKALYEFVNRTEYKITWIGKNGEYVKHPTRDNGFDQPAALLLSR